MSQAGFQGDSESPSNLVRLTMLGRITCHLVFWTMDRIPRIEHEGATLQPRGIVFHEGEITLPVEEGEIEQLAAEAGRTFARKGGAAAFEDTSFQPVQ